MALNPYVAAAIRSQRSQQPTMDPAQRQSIMSRGLNMALTPIAAVGNTLDLARTSGNDLIMSGLTGKWHNPFDQWLTPFSPENRVEGRDINRQLGWAGPEDNWSNFIGGIATEIVTDPLSYLSLGGTKALSLMGKAAEKAGLGARHALKAQAAKSAGKIGGESLTGLQKLMPSWGRGKRAAMAKTSVRDLWEHGDDFTRNQLRESVDPNVWDAMVSLDKGEANKFLDMPLGHGPSLTTPIGGGSAPFLSQAQNQGFASLMDVPGQLTGKLPVIGRMSRGMGMLFDDRAGNRRGEAAQGLARGVSGEALDLTPGARHAAIKIRGLSREFEGELHDDVLRELGAGNGLMSPDGHSIGDIVETVDGTQATVMGFDVDEIRLHVANPAKGKQRHINQPHFTAGDAKHELKQVHEYGSNEAAMGLRSVTRTVAGKIARFRLENPELDINRAFKEFLPKTSAASKISQRVQDIAEEAVSSFDNLQSDLAEMGGNMGMIDIERRGYAPRRANVDDAGFEKYGPQSKLTKDVRLPRNTPTSAASAKSRTDELRHMPEFAINRILLSEKDARSADSIMSVYGEFLDDTYGKGEILEEATKEARLKLDKWERAGRAVAGGDPAKLAQIDEMIAKRGEINIISQGSKEEHAEALAKWVKGRKRKELYTNHMYDDAMDYLVSGTAMKGNINAIHHQLMNRMSHVGDDVADALTVNQTLINAGINPDAGIRYQAKLAVGETEWNKLNAAGNEVALEELIDTMGSRRVDPKVSHAVLESFKKAQTPEWFDAVQELIGGITQVFKTGVTAIGGYPGFQFRNLISGQHLNISASGQIHNTRDLVMYGWEVWQTKKLMDRMRANKLTNADKELLTELEAQDFLQAKKTMHGELGGHDMPSEGLHVGPKGREIWKSSARKEIGQSARQAVQQNPMAAGIVDVDTLYPGVKRGINKARQGWAAAAEFGGGLNNRVEWANRVPLYTYLTRKKGWSARAAAEKVVEMQYDYGRMTDFEQKVMSNLVPFYKFSRLNAPNIYRNLLHKPGGGVAQTVRFYNKGLKENDEHVRPQRFEGKFAFRQGGGKTKVGGAFDRYFVGSGLAHEDALSLTPFSGSRNMLYSMASRASPLIQAPIEHMTDQSLFQRGRPYSSLDPTMGRTISNISGIAGHPMEGPYKTPPLLEKAIGYSPLSRLAGRVRTLTDARKGVTGDDGFKWTTWAKRQGVNQLTGFKFTDVDQKEQLRELNRRLGEREKELGARTFSRSYGMPHFMTPEQIEKFNELQVLRRELER